MTELLVEKYPAVYSTAESCTYVRQVGTKSYDYLRSYPQNNAENYFNAPDGVENNIGTEIKFMDNLNSDWFDLREMQLMVTGYVCLQNNHTQPLTPDRFSAFNPEFLFQSCRVRIGNTDIVTPSNKDNVYMSGHLKKLLSYSSPFAQADAGYEEFYPDTGLDARPNKVPFTASASVVTATDPAADTNYIQVGTQGGTNVQAGASVDVFQSALPHGNPGFTVTPNVYYNKGYEARQTLFNSAAIKPITFPVKIKYLVDSLDAFADVQSNVSLQVVFRRNYDRFCFQTAGDPTVGVAGQYPKFWMTYLELQTPTYRPDPLALSMLEAKLLAGTVTRRRWVDIDIIPYATLLTPGTAQTCIEFVNAINRRPVGAFLAYQFNAETNGLDSGALTFSPFNGNSMRFFNPGVTQARAMIGNQMVYPSTYGYQGDPTKANYAEFYRSFLKLTDYWRQSREAPLIDYNAYINHKFMIPFDFRDLDTSLFLQEGQWKLNFQINHTGLPAIPTGGIAPYIAQGSTLSDAAAPTTRIGGPVQVWLFLFQEREMIVTQSSAGVSVQFDVPPLI